MKTLRLLSAVLGLAAACALRAETVRAGARTDVIFDHPEKFADIRDMDSPTDKGEADILNRIRDYLVRETAHMIPEGYRLTMTFTDIHLAGNFEPWRGPQWDEVRIVKPVYPPMFKFTYAVTDPSGKVVRQGSVNIRDMNFQIRLDVNPDDPLHYEKDILGDWARDNLRDLTKA